MDCLLDGCRARLTTTKLFKFMRNFQLKCFELTMFFPKVMFRNVFILNVRSNSKYIDQSKITIIDMMNNPFVRPSHIHYSQ